MNTETITAAGLGFRPTDEPVGQCLVSKHDGFRRFGEGSFTKAGDGSLLLFHDRREGTDDLDKAALRVMRSRDGGRTWGDNRTVREEHDASILQPSLCRLGDGRLGMTYSRILISDTAQAAKLFVASEDDGASWTPPTPVSHGECSYMTGAHDRLTCLDGGRLVSLVHGKTRPHRPCHLVSYPFTSDDGGRSWVNRAPQGLRVDFHPFPGAGHEYGFWETSLVELGDGSLLLYGRNATGYVWASRSSDRGDTWSPPEPTGVPNPLSPMRLTQIPGTDVLLMFRNPLVDMPSGWHGGSRRALAVQASTDSGATWGPCRQLEFIADPEQWFDYPFLLWDGDTLHLGYRAPARSSFECSIYYQRLGKAELLALAESA